MLYLVSSQNEFKNTRKSKDEDNNEKRDFEDFPIEYNSFFTIDNQGKYQAENNLQQKNEGMLEIKNCVIGKELWSGNDDCKDEGKIE